jgi:hypothetical protein
VYKWYCRERDKVIKRVAEWECRKHVLILEGLTVHSMFKDLDLPWDREDFRHVYRMFQEVFTAHSKKPFYAATKPELTAAVKHHWPLWVQQGATDFKTFKLVVERLKKLIKALLELTSNCPSRYIGIYPEVWKVGRTAVGGPITHLPARSPFLLDLTYKGNTANPSIIIRCNARYVRFDGDKTLHNASLGKTYIQVLQFDSEENELYPYFVRHVDAAEDLIVAIRLDGTGFCRDLLCYENDSDIRHLKSIRIIIVPPRQPCPPYRPGALENNFKELFRTLVQHLDEESGTLTIVDADSLPSQWFTTQKMTTENYFLLHILMNALSPSDLLRLVTSRPNRKVPLMDFASKKEYMEDFEVSEWEYNIQCGF